MRRLSIPLALLLSLLFLDAAGGPAEKPQVFVRSRYLMGTTIEIKARGADAAATQAAVTAAFDEIARLEALMTTWRDDSQVARVNAMAGRGPVEVAPEVIEVVEKALGVSRLTGGADEAGVRIGLGGVAKGYAADRARAVLRKRGVRSAIVNAGGDMALLGSDGDHPWRVGVKDPRAPDRTLGWMDLADTTVHTSGDYERFRIINGVRYGHVLSPLTGYPATRAHAATVVCRDGAFGDALSTGLLVLGNRDGLRLVDSLSGIEALVVDNGGKLHFSGAMRKRFHPAAEPGA
jgi:thiamine biosynthesis lipoprotein